MGEPGPLGFEPGQLGAALGIGAAIIAPGEHAILADHGGAEEIAMTSRPGAGQAARRIKVKGFRPTVIASSQNQQSGAESSLLTAELGKNPVTWAISESNR